MPIQASALRAVGAPATPCDTPAMPSLTLPAPAKLNLFLHIVGRRADGYHQLQTLFQLLDYGDALTFTPRDDGEICLRSEGAVPEDLAAEDNLVMKAARGLAAAAAERGQQVRGADIVLDKRLPAGGGLGGGSSDAATTLLGLDHLWGLALGEDTLAALGARLGADVPVFVRGRSAWAEGIGEQLAPVDLPERWYLVIHPGCAVSTAEVFQHPELTRDTPMTTIAAFFAGDTRNDCENLVRRLAEPVDKALIWLQKFGNAALTGSGACVFASFASERAARAALSAMQREAPRSWQGFVARGVNRSPVLAQLEQRAV
jgi:4-diphosphocytidyl-2-C-methyl-D-erythritol kinase